MAEEQYGCRDCFQIRSYWIIYGLREQSPILRIQGGREKKQRHSVYPRVRLGLWLDDRGHSPALRDPPPWILARTRVSDSGHVVWPLFWLSSMAVSRGQWAWGGARKADAVHSMLSLRRAAIEVRGTGIGWCVPCVGKKRGAGSDASQRYFREIWSSRDCVQLQAKI